MDLSNQRATRAFLRTAGVSGGVATGTLVEEIETHISVIFLHRDRVLKLKKAVRFAYLDFSDPQTRLELCRREVDLNKRTAPELYRGVRTIVRRPDGSLALDEDGEVVDAVVEMARFEQDALFSQLALDGRLDDPLLDTLARRIADFHDSLPALPGRCGHDAIRRALAANTEAFAATSFATHPDVSALLANIERTVEDKKQQLESRGRSGRIRRCHGDLHLGNICLFRGQPTLFDCLEFDEDLASIDVLYDLAFLLMDLWRAGRQQAANRVFNRYLDHTGDTRDLGLMPLYVAMRATIRAHIAATRADSLAAEKDAAQKARREAQTHIDLARESLAARQPRLVAIGGLSGSGKSTAAAAVAPYTGPIPGARILSTDRIRKALWGADPLTQLPPEAYTPQMSERVYEAQRRETETVIAGGASVIADGVFLKAAERAAIAQVADAANVAFNGFWLEAPESTLVQRVEERRNDPSDATADVVRLQKQNAGNQTDWPQIDAGTTIGATRDQILRNIDA